MVINGRSRGGGAELARHLQRTDTNERMIVLEVAGVAPRDLNGALRDMEIMAAGARTGKPFYHANINTHPDERMNDEQRRRAIDRLEEELGLSGQPRVVVLHEKKGREHTHVVWSRIDAETMRAIPDSHNYRKHETVARELEREFGHARVQGAHVERDGHPRPERTPSVAEMRQADKSGLAPAEIKERVTELWRATDSGRAFAAALDQAGFVLARGDRRDFVLVDPAGETHSLARRIDGVKAAGVRERMADVNPENLPSVHEARAWQIERRHADATQRQADATQEAVRPELAKYGQAPDLPPEIARKQAIARHADAVWERFEHRSPSGPSAQKVDTADAKGREGERQFARQEEQARRRFEAYHDRRGTVPEQRELARQQLERQLEQHRQLEGRNRIEEERRRMNKMRGTAARGEHPWQNAQDGPENER